MENCKECFVEHVTYRTAYEKSSIKCCEIIHSKSNDEYTLKVGYSESEYNKFIKALNFSYEHENLEGRIWFSDDSWSVYNYDYDGNGHDGWDWCALPDIPIYLNKNYKE